MTKNKHLGSNFDDFLKEQGILVGTLFRAAPNPKLVPIMNSLKEMGAWFLPDRRMVRPLLASAGYNIKKCVYRNDMPGEESLCMQFIAEKATVL